jgi:hypothetical protein
MTALTAGGIARSGTVSAGGEPPAVPLAHCARALEMSPDHTVPEFWSAAIAIATLWLLFFIYAVVQALG